MALLNATTALSLASGAFFPPFLIVAYSDHDAMDDEQRRQDDWAKDRKNRLPTFTEVLSRRTRPPVDLFMF